MHNLSTRLPLIISLIFFLGTSSYWIVITEDAKDSLESKSVEVAEQFVSRIDNLVNNYISIIEDILLLQWIDVGSNRSLLFDYQRYLDIIPNFYNFSDAFLALNWINSSGFIKYVYPIERNKEVINRDIKVISDGSNNTALNTANKTKKTTLTNIITFVQGGVGVAAYIPIVVDNNITGFFNLVIETETLLVKVISQYQIINDYEFILQESQTLIYQVGERFTMKDSFTYQTILVFYSKTWTLTVRPNEALREKATYSENANLFIIALFSSVLTFYLANKISKTNKLLEREYKEKEIVMENLNKNQTLEALGTLAGGISHDFNNILMGIKGNVSLLENDILSKLKDENIDASVLSELENNIEMINTILNRSTDLTSQILAFSRPLSINFEIIDTSKIIQDVINLVKQTSDRRISFEFQNQSSTCFVYANKTKIFQAFMNIIINAVDAVDPSSGVISIFIYTDEYELDNSTLSEIIDKNREAMDLKNSLKIKIVDNGVGMSEEILSKAFDIFFTTKTRSKGTGLGLGIVQQVINSHGGKIEISSIEKLGTKVEISLPLVAIENADQQIRSQEIITKSPIKELNHDYQIIIVDDEKAITRVLSHYLKGMNVKIFNNGIKAFEYYRAINKNITYEKSILILDVNIPGINGIELFTKALEIYPQQKVLFITGYSDIDIPRKETNQVRILIKPFNSRQFKEELFLLSKY